MAFLFSVIWGHPAIRKKSPGTTNVTRPNAHLTAIRFVIFPRNGAGVSSPHDRDQRLQLKHAATKERRSGSVHGKFLLYGDRFLTIEPSWAEKGNETTSHRRHEHPDEQR